MGIGMDEVAFMGDDLPDLATLRGVGLAIVPANAHPWVLPAAHWVTPRVGGAGAARDACDLLLHAQGKVEAILAHGEHP
jgi:3-deoxy-D-manno-octulosonate 8-phosphate phosphatase (KDO 8-P phosphatase)